MVNEFKLTVVHFARPNPTEICACAWIYRWTKKLENQGWATGPPGRRAAAGPSGAVGRWAAGLLLAKPTKKSCLFNNKPPLQFRNKTVYNQLVLHNVRIP